MTMAKARTPGARLQRETLKALRLIIRRNADQAGSTKAGSTEAGTAGSDALLSAQDFHKVEKVIRRHRQNTDRLHRLATGNKCKAKLKDAGDHYLTNFTTRLCATVRAFAKKRATVSKAEIYEFARSLDVHERLSERVMVSFLTKDKGGFRPIVKSGIQRMAQQFMVRDLLTVLGVDSEFDFTRPGAGGEKAMIRDVCEHILDGYTFWQTADIKNCFASLGRGHLKWLPVPRHLLWNVLFIPRCAQVRISWSKAVREFLKAEAMAASSGVEVSPSNKEIIYSVTRRARSGLPQGAVSSPLVARAFVGREIRAVLGSHEVARSSFIDDLNLGARTEQEIRESLEALLFRLNGHPAGPLFLHLGESSSAEEGQVLAFGYKFRPGQGYGDNPIHVLPGRKRFDRFHRKLFAKYLKLREELHPDDMPGMEDFIIPHIGPWMASQQAWTTVPGYSRNLVLTGAVQYFCEHDVAPSP